MDENQLQSLVEKISIESFSKPFKHKASFNQRLRTTAGRYIINTHNIEINPKAYEKNGYDELLGVIKHELCHYHLHLQGIKHSHRSKVFTNCLENIGGSKYSKPIYNRSTRDRKYLLICKSCQQHYPRKKKMNPVIYRCGKCGGELILKTVDNP